MVYRKPGLEEKLGVRKKLERLALPNEKKVLTNPVWM
jgi:hypothetical protein